MPAKTVKNNRGIALLITITIITILIAVTLELNRKMRSSVISTAATRDLLTLSHMASSGINAAIAMLVKDKNESDIDSLQEDWADPEKIAEILKDIPFEDGNVTLKISDELAKIQVNALVSFPEGRNFNESQRNLWERLLRQLILLDESFEDADPTSIINSVKDWLDFGDDDAITGLNGAESDYYKDLDLPYSCKNGPFTHLGELVLVKGITPELFHGFGGIPGISKYMTIYGVKNAGGNNFTYEGKININTAELPVLMAILPSEYEYLAQNIYDYRKETSDSKYIHDLSSPTWYKKVPGWSDEIKIDNLITRSSDFFRIESTATLNKMKTSLTAVVHREKDKKSGKFKCKVLNLHEE